MLWIVKLTGLEIVRHLAPGGEAASPAVCDKT